MKFLAALTLVALLLLAARTASAQDEVAAEPQDAVVDPYRDAVDSENAVPEDAVGAEDPELPTPGDDTSPEPEDAVGEKPAALEDSTPAKTAAGESAAPEEPKQGAGTEGVTPDTAASTEPPSSRSAVDWLRAGVEAYLSESWGQCVRSLENALVEWNFFRRAHIECRLRCGAEARRARPLFPDDVEHLHFVEEMVRATLCLIKCKRTAFRGRATGDNIPDDQKQTFRDLKPYEYLQLCYYQVSEIQKAASAVFTILSHDPSNEIMKNNLKFYLATGDVDDKAIINYEAEKYVSLYLRGTEAYYSEDYGAAVINLEASLKEFLHAAEECRADCEGPFDQGWLPDFTSSIANHYVFCLKCKAKCHSKLSQLNGDKYEDFLPMHYNYLQFAYYKRGNLEKACAAAATYLMFSPADETMMENVEYYKSLPKVHAGMFQPIADAEHYVKRQAYEEALLRYISDEFVFEDSKENNPPPSDEVNLVCECLWNCICTSKNFLVSIITSRSKFPRTLLQGSRFSIASSFIQNITV